MDKPIRVADEVWIATALLHREAPDRGCAAVERRSGRTSTQTPTSNACDPLFTSALTLGEIHVRPVEADDTALVVRYTRAIEATAVVVRFSADAAPAYARIRLDRFTRPPDAIHFFTSL